MPEQEAQLPQRQRASNIALHRTVKKAFRYVEPFGRESPSLTYKQTDRRSDKQTNLFTYLAP